MDQAPEPYKKWLESEIKYLKETINKDASVLDIGCGGGRVLEVLYGVTKNMVGIDHDEEAIKLAKKNLGKYPEIKLLLAKAEKLPFEDNSFDFVICIGTLSNLGDVKIQALNEMKRVVKKEGIIIVSCYAEDAFEERMKVYKQVNAPIKEIKGTTVLFDEQVGDNTSEQFSKEELEQMFNDVNLEITEIKKFGIGYDCKLRKK